jgi:hypothetical protein
MDIMIILGSLAVFLLFSIPIFSKAIKCLMDMRQRPQRVVYEEEGRNGAELGDFNIDVNLSQGTGYDGDDEETGSELEPLHGTAGPMLNPSHSMPNSSQSTTYDGDDGGSGSDLPQVPCNSPSSTIYDGDDEDSGSDPPTGIA